MKIILIFLTLSFAIAAQSQTATFGQLTKKSNYSSYITKQGDTISIGEKLYINIPSSDRYTFITQGNVAAGAIIAGTTVTVKKIKTYGTKKRGYKTYVGFGGYGTTVWIDYENALAITEIERL